MGAKGKTTNFYYTIKGKKGTIKIENLVSEIYETDERDGGESYVSYGNKITDIIKELSKMYLEDGKINPESEFAETYAISLYNSSKFSTHSEKRKRKQFLEAKKIFDDITKKIDFSKKIRYEPLYGKNIYFPAVENKIGKLGYEGMYTYGKICLEESKKIIEDVSSEIADNSIKRKSEKDKEIEKKTRKSKKLSEKAKKLFSILANTPENCSPQRMRNIRDDSLKILTKIR
jgi:hypothetical protein